ncbi:kanadaptin-like [Tubulanus polymorphus]|uniref:kanadaptin-like n=1 Tax=Tubulanus polymorphus TaxID=672921 RepID=UPI003DA4BA44
MATENTYDLPHHQEEEKKACELESDDKSSKDLSSSVKMEQNVDETLSKSEEKPMETNEDKTESESTAFKKPTFILPASLPKVNTAKLSPSGENNSQQTQTLAKNVPKPPKSDSKMKSLSPAEKLKHAQTSIPYKEPAWSGLCETEYQFEILKNGTIIDTIKLTDKPFYVFGRLPSCDVSMEHLSLSRHHAIVQYCVQKTDNNEVGWYLYDLDSTHGTWINKNKVHPRTYYRIRVGHVIKFGGSSRLYILQGPPDDQDAESELTITEMKLQREKQKAQAELLKQANLDEIEAAKQKVQQDTSCSWGMGDDAIEDSEEPDEVNPFALAEESELTFDDPKKELKKYFEREGHDIPEYEFLAAGYGKHHCRIELPVDTSTGHPMVAEALVSGKKKDAVVACAMEALRILDRLGELRKSSHESKKRKKKNWEDDDFYDSDDDTFLDRTGVIEQKRLERMKKAGKDSDTVETYDSLVEKLKVIETEIVEITKQLENAKQATLESDDVDDLDAYMSSLKSGAMDKRTRMKLKSQLFELKHQEQKLRRLANIAKPASLPAIMKLEQKAAITNDAQKGTLPLTGKIKGPVLKPAVQQTSDPGFQHSEVEVEEDDDENETAVVEKKSTVEDSKDHIKTTDNSPVNEKSYGLIKPNEDKLEKVVKIDKMQTKNENSSQLSQTETDSKVNSKEVKSDKCQRTENPSKLDKSAEVKSFPIKRKSDKLVSKVKKMKEYTETDDPNYAVWMPPADQTGDGKTKLNEKYGY